MSRRAGLSYRDPRKAEPYAEALRAAGIEPVLISPDQPRSLSGLAGLLLSGGTDLDPALYGERPHGLAQTPDTERDRLEIALLGEALERDLPVLAICRGMQLFHVVHGGRLIQHLESADRHVVRSADPSLAAHDVRITPGTRLAAIFGCERLPVNSRHHQGVIENPRLTISARSEDGVIEALEDPDRRFAVAVQWHPEDQISRYLQQKRLFEAFAGSLGKNS